MPAAICCLSMGASSRVSGAAGASWTGGKLGQGGREAGRGTAAAAGLAFTSADYTVDAGATSLIMQSHDGQSNGNEEPDKAACAGNAGGGCGGGSGVCSFKVDIQQCNTPVSRGGAEVAWMRWVPPLCRACRCIPCNPPAVPHAALQLSAAIPSPPSGQSPVHERQRLQEPGHGPLALPGPQVPLRRHLRRWPGAHQHCVRGG